MNEVVSTANAFFEIALRIFFPQPPEAEMRDDDFSRAAAFFSTRAALSNGLIFRIGASFPSRTLLVG